MACSKLSARIAASESSSWAAVSEFKSASALLERPSFSVCCAARSCSLSWISRRTASIRSFVSSSFRSTARICSLKTLICPSLFPESRSVSFNSCCLAAVAASSFRISSSSRSYSAKSASDSVLEPFMSPETVSRRSSSSICCLEIASISCRNRFASRHLNSSRRRKYSFAAAACFSKGPTCFSSSLKISFTRTRFCSSSSSFFSASAFRRLNFTIPAASSKSSLRSSGRPLKILSIWPWPIMEYPSFPIPVS